MKTVILVIGHVQGVGFRFFTEQWAKKHHINGTVQNCSDGSVRIETDATGTLLALFIAELEKGMSPYARVQEVHHYQETHAEPFHDFRTIG